MKLQNNEVDELYRTLMECDLVLTELVKTHDKILGLIHSVTMIKRDAINKKTSNILDCMKLKIAVFDHYGIQEQDYVRVKMRWEVAAKVQCFIYHCSIRLNREGMSDGSINRLAEMIHKDHASILYCIRRTKELLSINDAKTLNILKEIADIELKLKIN